MSNKKYINPLQMPTPDDSPAMWDLVMEDMVSRDEMGKVKYGQRLKADDGRDPLIDAYQEVLDLAVYLRKELYNRYKE